MRRWLDGSNNLLAMGIGESNLTLFFIFLFFFWEILFAIDSLRVESLRSRTTTIKPKGLVDALLS